jgi:hypothetical protein
MGAWLYRLGSYVRLQNLHESASQKIYLMVVFLLSTLKYILQYLLMDMMVISSIASI